MNFRRIFQSGYIEFDIFFSSRWIPHRLESAGPSGENKRRYVLTRYRKSSTARSKPYAKSRLKLRSTRRLILEETGDDSRIPLSLHPAELREQLLLKEQETVGESAYDFHGDLPLPPRVRGSPSTGRGPNYSKHSNYFLKRISKRLPRVRTN